MPNDDLPFAPRRTLVWRGFVSAAVCLAGTAVVPAASATTLTALVSAGTGAGATGIYRVASAAVAGKTRVTQALVCNGVVKEMHTTNGGVGYLNRKPGSPAIKVPTAAFSSLAAAGGLDQNVNHLSASVKNAFSVACGGSSAPPMGSSGGSTSPPLQVGPTGKTGCPPGYTFNMTTKKCHLQSSRPLDDADERVAGRADGLARWLFKLVPASSAHAMLKDLYKRVFVTWQMEGLGKGFHYSYTPVDGAGPGYPADTVGYIEVQGGGFLVGWIVTAN
ncbi:MAG: hypothetical protein Q8M01_12530 [Rubrivivax sp.]|nr:hypothetical protein [Rubrivivax sp.]